MYYWTTFDSWIIDAECLTSSATRTNHHGLIGGRSYYAYEWTVAYHFIDASKTCCVFRACYNITTDDYKAWEFETSVEPGLDCCNNLLVKFPDPDDDQAFVKLWKTFDHLMVMEIVIHDKNDVVA